MKSHRLGIAPMGLAIAIAAAIGCSSRTTDETAPGDGAANCTLFPKRPGPS